MSTKIINLSIAPGLVKLIDAQAKREFASRSEYIKRAIMTQLKTDAALNNLAPPQTFEEMRQEQLKKFLEDYEAGHELDITL